jgi:hypothetical protein
MTSVPPQDRDDRGGDLPPDREQERDPEAERPAHRSSTPGYLDEAGVGTPTVNDAIEDESVARLGGAGTGYASAVDDHGSEGAGEDVSGDDYVEPGSAPEEASPGAGTGYASAVDDHGAEGAGEDVSGGDYTAADEGEEPVERDTTADDVLRMDSSERDRH